MVKAHVTKRDATFMRLALSQAHTARALGEIPVGAVAVLFDRSTGVGSVIGAGFNRKERDNNPTAHAEIIAMQQAAQFLGTWRLRGVSLYCTLEPCPMCAGAMIQARLPRLVYGATDSRFGADGSIVDVLAANFNHRVDVTRGVLEEESLAMLQAFFQSLRAKRTKRK